MGSVRSIAAQARVSPATVSRVLNGFPGVGRAIRERVQACIDRAGYVPRVGRRITNVVALAYPGELVWSRHPAFEPALHNGIMRGLAQRGFDLKLLNISRDKRPDENYTQFFLRKHVRGVIMRCFRSNSATISAIAEEGFPSVVVGGDCDEPKVALIRSDSYPSSRRAIEHLIGLGHRRIALAIHDVADTDHTDRRRAYEDALAASGIEVDPGLVMGMTENSFSGERVLDAMTGLRKPATAILTTNPTTAIGIMLRAQERGIVIPRDLSVVGVDDSDMRVHVWPRLTAVVHNTSTLGQEAAHWLTSTLSWPTAAPACRWTTSTTFEVNGTTAPPRKVKRASP